MSEHLLVCLRFWGKPVDVILRYVLSQPLADSVHTFTYIDYTERMHLAKLRLNKGATNGLTGDFYTSSDSSYSDMPLTEEINIYSPFLLSRCILHLSSFLGWTDQKMAIFNKVRYILNFIPYC